MLKFLILFITPISVFAQGFPEVDLPTNINAVTVYLNGAQVTRSGEVQLPAGETVVIAKGLTPRLNDQSIQVKAEGAFTLLAVNHRINYLQDLLGKDEKVDSLKNELSKVVDLISMEQAKQKIIQEKASLLDANKKLAGENTSVSVTQLQQVVKYFETEMTAMAKARITSMNETKALEEQKSKIEQQLNEWNGRASTPSSEIMIRVRADRATKARFGLSYLATNAGWTPQYDIRANSVNSPVELSYKAEVYQNTGVDWKDVQLSFSNGNPNQSGTAPRLSTWYLDFYQEARLFGQRAGFGAQPMAAPAEEDFFTEEETAFGFGDEEEVFAMAEVIETNVVEGATTVEFQVPIPYTVESNGDRFSVDLSQHELEAIYQYYAVPKMDKDAFLVARVVDWGQLNLLSGRANLYFEDAYVGRSYLNAANVTDTLDLSLGRDRGIVITRERIDQFSKKRTIGNSKTESRGWKLSARNTKSQPVSLVVFDQVPVSTNSEIEVDVMMISNGSHNKQTGEVNWKMELDPQQSRDWNLQYEVKYPKKRKVILE